MCSVPSGRGRVSSRAHVLVEKISKRGAVQGALGCGWCKRLEDVDDVLLDFESPPSPPSPPLPPPPSSSS